MRTILYLSLLIVLSESLPAQTLNTRNRNGSKTVFEGQPASIRLAPHVTTTIRLPEAVNSVVLGDSNLFQAEYSPKEPLLVFATPTASDIAESNLVISTVFGRQFVLILRSRGVSTDPSQAGVDLLVTCQAAAVRFIEETSPSGLISETLNLRRAAQPGSPETVPLSEGGIPMKLVLQWGIPGIAILLLLAFKYGKPRGYLGDWWRYQTRPHVYCGLERDSQLNVPYLMDIDGE